ncbi:BREX-1 system phosphatase PglZ type A [Burkholderia sp. Ac-20353]|uniref:BREX-1 system phosphatase PglZ type A n=1 Tax=Burkholderia sp. Ac-20353 TaxID=2703894 RepID=UPI00197BC601|nr:BREX-1 system phosphatase PglZ type A [Burkholderia sp. Ac-20353]MBN3791438.1 BREX-1 system phosphatase PglZ type A [Burkholderia sp. Ac-20353]
MDTQQLTQGLRQAFFAENHRIVFWYDPEQSFADELSQLDIPDVQLLNMQSESTFGLKLKLELEDTQGKYLLYFPCAEPEANDDWLLDIKLYSRSFYADKVSLIFNDLNLQQQSLRQHLSKRESFLSNKVRVGALKRLIQLGDTEKELDLAMIAVVLGAGAYDITTLLCTLADSVVSDNLGLETNPATIDELYKYGLMPALLQSLRDEVGYPTTEEELSGEKPFSFGHLLIRLLTTDFCESISDIPSWASAISMPSANARATCRALLSRWRDSSRFYKIYDEVSTWVGEALHFGQKVTDIPVAVLANVATFEAVERQIIVDLTLAIPEASPHDLKLFSRIIADRLDNYWASRHKDDEIRRKYRLLYSALAAAIELFTLRHQYGAGFHYTSSEALYKAYEGELYRFDTAYRRYGAASQRAHVELLKKLDEAVEQCYAYWYIDQLARCWGDRVEAEQRLEHWKIAGIPNQQDFYERWVRPQFEGHRSKRVVVIISDAFRFEAAVELRERINEKRYSEATLASQLGVLPSYTSLGMASLLPHKTLEYREGNGDTLFVDGQATGNTLLRDKILAQHHGMAVTAQQVKEWSRDAGREALKDQQLVYVYHNVIDDRSDKGGGSESDTFHHVELAIEELTELTRKILMHFNTSTVLITADHGFLFQQSKLEAADRTSLVDKPESAIKSKKRYVLGYSLPAAKDVWHGSTKQTAGTLSDTHFWVPKGANRFHFVGGARFVHGGAMPQEIVVPVLTVNQLRGEKAEKRTKRKVGVISPKSALKMVNSIQRFDLMQTEAVTEQVMPITVAVTICEGDQPVSSEEVVTFDCATDSMSERLKQVRLSLSGSDFDRRKDYFLIIRDKDLNTELERYRVTIDLAFTDDFF